MPSRSIRVKIRSSMKFRRATEDGEVGLARPAARRSVRAPAWFGCGPRKIGAWTSAGIRDISGGGDVFAFSLSPAYKHAATATKINAGCFIAVLLRPQFANLFYHLRTCLRPAEFSNTR